MPNRGICIRPRLVPFTVLLLLSCAAPALVSTGCGPRVVYVVEEPPPPRLETPPMRPHPRAVWVPGRWRWTRHGYHWLPGHWENRPKGHAWVEGHWERTPRGWRWIPGHWRR